ncbi:hypothetical protein RDWZM_001827 [Blomia tropicalis]|uniref:IF140/IFT172/WDR19 TPR domain-containing protein n=1 Tax=Blomia tropicalis TaxID=40697 RepID=A0A9Q0MCW1_BLOTA|nr:hypothetical protein RDWZM_001827 [Blomia tropicalis]
MKLEHDQSLSSPLNLVHDGSDSEIRLTRIECIAISSEATKLAACFSTSNHIALFDLITNQECDKFALKSNVTSKSAPTNHGSSVDGIIGKKSFQVRGICFSPGDGDRLAVGQTDCVIYVYRIGSNWGEKKTIVNKFNLASPVSGLYWLPQGLLYSSFDGRVKFIQTQSNKMFSVLSSNSICVSLAFYQDLVVAGFYSDSSSLSSAASSRVRNNLSSSTPNGSAGSGKLIGPVVGARQTIEWGSNLNEATCSPSGTIVIFSSKENLIVFEMETNSRTWRMKMTVKLSGSFLITGLCWSLDGTRLFTSYLNGGIDQFRCRYRSKLYGARFEVNYIGNRQLAINDLEQKSISSFTSNSDILDVRIIKQAFAVVWTANTLIMGSLTDPKARSEIEWHGLTTSGVRFSFDYENVVLISAVGELFLVELGQDKILGSVRTDFVSPHLLSIRIMERKRPTKVFAYLLDVKTISVVDLTTGLQICTWSHNERIDWIELNETGNKLIYRDKALKLILLNILNQEFSILLNICGFVQWVPGSDVIVAQSKDRIYVWYDFSKPVVFPVQGGEMNEAIEIERENGRTLIKMTNPGTDIQLDEVLLEFDTAIDDGDLERAESFLESLENNSTNTLDTTPMWLLLGNIALKQLNLSVGERAFAALGDVAKVSFIKACQQDSSMIALLDHDWSRFESGDFDQVLSIYLRTYNWERAIAFAQKHSRTDLVEKIQTDYYKWLIETGQTSIAAQILEKSGKIEESIAMYLKSGRMLQVTKLILNHYQKTNEGVVITDEMVRKVIDQLLKMESFEEAGDLYQLNGIEEFDSALAAYVKGCVFSKAIHLAKDKFPDEVVRLENQYGEYLLVEMNDPSTAVAHFIEAGKTDRALEAAIAARQFDRAAEIASILDHVPAFYGKRIADYYASKEDLESALDMYINSGCIRDAVQMLNTRGQYARAFKIAKKLMDQSEANEMYEYIAKGYENDGKFKEAEKIYLACGDADSAISMYKSNKMYDHMIRLVKQYHPQLLTETSIYLAKELEADRLYKQAETHYVSVGEWKQAARMYRDAEHWEDAYRVSRAHGGAVAAKQVAFHWSQTLANPSEAIKLLNRYGLSNQVLDYAIEINEYDFALALIIAGGPELRHKLVDVRVKYALWLETEGKYHEAESMFIEANKPKEAVLMYLHAYQFDEALRVAETSLNDDEEVIKDVLTAQARFMFDRDKQTFGIDSANFTTTLSKVESLLLRAGRIEIAVRLYKDVGLWNEAGRICEQYAPHLIEQLKREMIAEASGSSDLYYSKHQTSSVDAVSQRPQSMENSSVNVEQAPPQVDLNQALKVAEQNDDKDSIIRYTILLATQLLKDRLTLESLKILQKHDSVFILPDSKKLLSRIAVILLSELEDFTWSGMGESANSRIEIYSTLRDCFLQLMNINPNLNNIEHDLFEKYLLITHYLSLKTILETIIAESKGDNPSNLRELHLKITVSLLRYTDVIRADKAFFEAGSAARDSRRLDMGFVFLNHFLDLLDAIDEHDYNVDHSDFVGTDIPYEVPLPSKSYYAEHEVEEIKSWILQTSMDTDLSQSLPIDPLREGDIYEASLINSDGSRCLPCLATGYPVIRHKAIEFKSGKYAANKEDWNKLLMLAKITENVHLRQVLHFIGRLCGNNTIVKFSFQ